MKRHVGGILSLFCFMLFILVTPLILAPLVLMVMFASAVYELASNNNKILGVVAVSLSVISLVMLVSSHLKLEEKRKEMERESALEGLSRLNESLRMYRECIERDKEKIDENCIKLLD